MSSRRRTAVGDATHKRSKLAWLAGGGGAFTFIFLAPVVLFAGAGNPPCSPGASTVSGAPITAGGTGHGGFEETAYGPPWNAINGTGVTATGVNLTAGPPMLEIAVDPSVLALRSYYHVEPNPFGAKGAFAADDTGGAIIGNHVDTYDWLGRAHQLAWGTRYGVSVTKAANPGSGSNLGQVSAPGTPVSLALQNGCAKSAGALGVNVPPGVYVNPFQQTTNMMPGRIDQGVDYTASGPILAIGNATVTYSQATGAGWGPYPSCDPNHDAAVVYTLTDGPDRGRPVYTAEGIVPLVNNGQHIHAGQPVATFDGCIEIGWGAPGGGDGTEASALGQQAPGDPGSWSTGCGASMSALIAALHGAPGILQGPIHGSTAC